MPLAISKERWSQMFDGSSPAHAVHRVLATGSNAICRDDKRFAHWEQKTKQAISPHTVFVAQVGGEAKILLELADDLFAGQFDQIADYLARLVSQNEIQHRFQKLADTWEDETSLLSSPTEMAQHPAYREIISMGRDVVPFILKRMEELGGHWFWALSLLTGEDPIPKKSRGKVSAMRKAWLKWGSKRGYC